MAKKKVERSLVLMRAYADLARELVAEIPSRQSFLEQEELWNELVRNRSESEVLPLIFTDIRLEFRARIVAIFLTPSGSHPPFNTPRLAAVDPLPRVKLVEDIPAELLSFAAQFAAGALKLEFNSLVEVAVELLCRLEPGTEDADRLYGSIPLAYTSEFDEFGYHGYMILMTKSGEQQVPQMYKERADVAMRDHVFTGGEGNPAVWYARTLEFLALDTPYDPAFLVSQLEFVMKSTEDAGKRYETVFGFHNGVFTRIYHFLADDQWKDIRIQFIRFARGYIEAWAQGESNLEEIVILQKIAGDIKESDPEFAKNIAELTEINLNPLRKVYDDLQERQTALADILSRMR